MLRVRENMSLSEPKRTLSSHADSLAPEDDFPARSRVFPSLIIHSGTSVDQRIAAHVGEETPQSSIVLACEQPMTGYHESNFSMA